MIKPTKKPTHVCVLAKRFLATTGVIFLLSSSLSYAQDDRKNESVNWHHLSFETDSVFGIGTTRTYQYIAEKNYKPKKEIVVAVIDGGVDIDHEDLKSNIWTNKKERFNGKDDDKNGYIDDIHGWNFLGKQSDTLALEKVGTEAFREYKRLRPIYENLSEEQVSLLSDNEKKTYDYFLKIRKKAGIGSYLYYTAYLKSIAESFREVNRLLTDTHDGKELVLNDLKSLHPVDSIGLQHLAVVVGSTFMHDSLTSWRDIYDYHIANFELAQSRVQSLDNSSSPRDSIVGDDVTNIDDQIYGNPNVNSYAYHGTVVSGIIAAVRENGLGVDGIANRVKIMPIRAIPEGDEYDKDVALAIRYAVDNGANIINMSFGKDLSPNEEWVKDAIRYASERNVLLVQAAGNSGVNIDSLAFFPSGYMDNGKKSDSYIRVGASTPEGTPFASSNYGKKEVDLFAPGADIYTLTMDNNYGLINGGTSLAAPMVSGAAALIWTYFPKLTATQLKEIIVSSVTKRENQYVTPPGKAKEKESVLFSELSASGGILNVYAAFKKAQILSKQRKSSILK